MTGFGRGVAEKDGARATVDVRSVNHRFLDLKLRGATITPAAEEAITTRVRAVLERGSVTVGIHVTRDEVTSGITIDPQAARTAHAALAQLATTLGIAGPDLALVLAQPGVTTNAAQRDDDSGPVVIAALDAALVQLGEMRETEGAALARELTSRIDELARLHAQLDKLAAAVPEQMKRRLTERLRRLLDEPPDPARLAQEIALLADRSDVSEELVRLTSHLAQARTLIAGTSAAGRRLDFLIQEIGRELNTIGSKSAVTEISSAIVEAKAVLEKVREQVQNVE
jgi:uncharacterized protein (TIGR00255 family)